MSHSSQGGHVSGGASTGNSASRGSGQGLSSTPKLSRVENVVFSVLYTMVKDNNSTRPALRLGLIVIDTLQIMGLAFNSDVSWGADSLSFLRVLSNPFGLFPLVLFWVIYALALLALLLSCVNFYFVARDLMSGDLTWVWPVRTLRFLCTLIITVFYMPILNVLLLFLECEPGGQDMPSRVRSFPEVECWGTTALVPSVLSIAALTIFIPLALIFRLVFFNPEPISKDPLARPLSRVECFWLFLKTAVVFCFRLTRDPMVQGFVVMIAAAIILAGQLLFMPMYRRSTNHIVAAFHGVNLGVGISMLVATTSLNVVIKYSILGVMMVTLAGGAVALSELRWRFLLNNALNSLEAIKRKQEQDEELEAGDGSGILAVIAATKTSNLVTSAEAQLYARIILNSPVLDDDLGDRVEAMYKYAIDLYPRDASLLVSYSNFLNFFRKNPHLATVQNRQTAKLSPAFDVRFLAYCAKRVSFEENKAKSIGEGRLDVLTFLEFQKMFNHTTRYHKETLVLMKNFWRALLSDSVDVAELRRLTSLISASEKKASNAYQQILKAFPHNKQICRSAAAFMANVHHDYDMATYYEEQAEDLEPDREGSVSRRSAFEWSKMGIDEASIAEHRGYRENLNSRRSAAVERLSKVGVVSLCLLSILAIVIYVVVHLLLLDYENTLILMDKIAVRRFLLQSAMLDTMQLVVGQIFQDDFEYTDAALEMRERMGVLAASNNELYLETFGKVSDELDAEWSDLQLTFESPVVNASAFSIDQKDGTVIFLLLCEEVTKLSMEEFTANLNMIDTVFQNAYGSIRTPFEMGLDPGDRVPDPKLANSFERTAYLFSGSAQNDIMNTFYAQLGLFIFAAVTIFLLAVAFVRPALNAVRKERTDTFSLFLTIPKGVVRQVHDQISANSETAKVKDKLLRTTADDNEPTEDRADKRFRLQLFLSLAFIGLLFGVSVVVTSVILFDARDTAFELNNSDRRHMLAQRTHFLGLALTAKSVDAVAVRMLPSFDTLMVDMHDVLLTFTRTHRVVVAGGVDVDNRELAGIGTSDARQAQLSNDEICLINPPPCDPENAEWVGLEKIQQHFVQKGHQAADVAIEEFRALALNHTYPPEILEMLRVKKLMNAGLQQSTKYIVEDAINLARTGKINSAILMSVIVFAIFLVYLVLFHPIVSHLRMESYRTSALLLMIPPSAISEVDTVRHFLETGQILGLNRNGKDGKAKEAAKKKKEAADDVQELMLGRSTLDDLNHLGLSYVAVDAHSNIIECSQRFCADTMYGDEELVGKNLAILFDDSTPEPSLRDLESGPPSIEQRTQEHTRAVMASAGVDYSGANTRTTHPPIKIKTKLGSLIEVDIRTLGISLNGMSAAVAVLTRRPVSAATAPECDTESEGSSSFDFNATGSTYLYNSRHSNTEGIKLKQVGGESNSSKRAFAGGSIALPNWPGVAADKAPKSPSKSSPRGTTKSPKIGPPALPAKRSSMAADQSPPLASPSSPLVPALPSRTSSSGAASPAVLTATNPAYNSGTAASGNNRNNGASPGTGAVAAGTLAPLRRKTAAPGAPAASAAPGPFNTTE